MSLKVTVKWEASYEMEPYLRAGVSPELKISRPEKVAAEVIVLQPNSPDAQVKALDNPLHEERPEP